jgi:hypothetical protein
MDVSCFVQLHASARVAQAIAVRAVGFVGLLLSLVPTHIWKS